MATQWIETKKECEINEKGELIPKRITLEAEKKKYFGLEKKDVFDIAFRFIGLAAIFIPLLLFYNGQKAERDWQKAVYQLDVYSKATTELHSMLNKEPGTIEFEQSKNRFLNDIYSKFFLISNKGLLDTLKKTENVLTSSSILYEIVKRCDSIVSFSVNNYIRDTINIATTNLKGDNKFYSAFIKDVMSIKFLNDRIKSWKSDSKKVNIFTDSFQLSISNGWDSLYDPYRELRLLVFQHRYRTLNERGNDVLINISSDASVSRKTAGEYQVVFQQILFPLVENLDSMMIKSSAVLYND